MISCMILILTTITQNSDPLNLISLWARHRGCGHPGFTVHNTALHITHSRLNICLLGLILAMKTLEARHGHTRYSVVLLFQKPSVELGVYY